MVDSTVCIGCIPVFVLRVDLYTSGVDGARHAALYRGSARRVERNGVRERGVGIAG